MTEGKTLIGTHCYDILANHIYAEKFQYIPTNIYDRHEFIIDSDDDETNDDAQSNLTRVALNMAYLPVKVAENLKFDKQSLRAAQKELKQE